MDKGEREYTYTIPWSTHTQGLYTSRRRREFLFFPSLFLFFTWSKDKVRFYLDSGRIKNINNNNNDKK